MEENTKTQLDRVLEQIEDVNQRMNRVDQTYNLLYSSPVMCALDEVRKDINSLKEKIEEMHDIKRYLKKIDYFFYTNYDDFRTYFTHDIDFENRMRKKE